MLKCWLHSHLSLAFGKPDFHYRLTFVPENHNKNGRHLVFWWWWSRTLTNTLVHSFIQAFPFFSITGHNWASYLFKKDSLKYLNLNFKVQYLILLPAIISSGESLLCSCCELYADLPAACAAKVLSNVTRIDGRLKLWRRSFYCKDRWWDSSF